MSVPGRSAMSCRSRRRLSPGRRSPTVYSNSLPAGCCTPAGRWASTTTPLATPVPGLETVIASFMWLPTSTRLVAGGLDHQLRLRREGPRRRRRRRSGRWPRCRSRPRQSASTAPGPPIVGRAGGRPAPDQLAMRSAAAGGAVSSSRVPRGIWSRTSTLPAVACPLLRTVMRKVAGLPTWTSRGQVFSMVSCGLCGPSKLFAAGLAGSLAGGGVLQAGGKILGRPRLLPRRRPQPGRRQHKPRPESRDCRSRWARRRETAPAPGCPRPRQAACSDRRPAAVLRSDRPPAARSSAQPGQPYRLDCGRGRRRLRRALSGGRLDYGSRAVGLQPGEGVRRRCFWRRMLARRRIARRRIARQRQHAGVAAGKQIGHRRVP